MEREESAATIPKKMKIVLFILLLFVTESKQIANCKSQITNHKQLTITFTTSVSFIAFYIEDIDYSYVLKQRIACKHVATQKQLYIVNLDSIFGFWELEYQHQIKEQTDPMMSFTMSSI